VRSPASDESLEERVAEIIEKVNGLFEGELTDDDQIVYVNEVIKKKMLESDELVTLGRKSSYF
jgi:type I restriction enzyme, R subunit